MLRRILENDETRNHIILQNTGFWGRAGAGCVIVARDTGRILLPHRSRMVEQPGTWGTWGGAIDRGMTPESAVRNEVSEEAGYSGHMDLIPLFVYRHKNGFVYHNFAAIVDHEFFPTLNWETDDSRWIEFGDWPSPMHFGLKSLLSDPASISKLEDLCSVDRSDLLEAPMEWGGYHDLSTPVGPDEPEFTTLSPVDRKLVQNPKYVQKVKKLWKSSVVDVIAYIVRMDLDKFPLAINVGDMERSEYEGLIRTLRQGKLYRKPQLSSVSMLTVANKLGIEPVDGKITVIYYKNPNDNGQFALPLTPWILAHRLAHAIESASPASMNMLDRVIRELNTMGGAAFIMGLSKLMRSADDQDVRTSELVYEVMAKYILTGKLRFRPFSHAADIIDNFSSKKMGSSFDGFNSISEIETAMERLCHVAIEDAKGGVFVI